MTLLDSWFSFSSFTGWDASSNPSASKTTWISYFTSGSLGGLRDGWNSWLELDWNIGSNCEWCKGRWQWDGTVDEMCGFTAHRLMSSRRVRLPPNNLLTNLVTLWPFQWPHKSGHPNPLLALDSYSPPLRRPTAISSPTFSPSSQTQFMLLTWLWISVWSLFVVFPVNFGLGRKIRLILHQYRTRTRAVAQRQDNPQIK